MMDTDFDLLCDGVNPAEAKRLRKILAEWCSGDENSFPVQLALLTKAQWRAIGRLPHILRNSQKDWQQDQASHRARFSEQFNSALDDARRLAGDSKKLLDAVQADHRRQIAAQSKTTIEAIDGRLKQGVLSGRFSRAEGEKPGSQSADLTDAFCARVVSG